MTGIRDLKYRQWFRGADGDGDGVITLQDVRLMGERYIAARAAAPESETARRLTEGLDAFWATVIEPMDRDGDGKVDLREMTEGFRRALADPALYPQQVGPVADCYFDLVDLDGDDRIDRAEFREIFGLAGNVSSEDCAAVFDALDVDGSGGLNRAEFHRALAEFFYGEDPEAPAAHLFGRIAG
ncbi:EF-hand domain-containing protein [Saccharothrix algeriensis]|uniref:Ca2+-binding EF-hand superfamily protein n=1 Tax=Saccharothrix algeriensis TaxID=173560 RepID=A0A8T8HW57_9PSEU|nr:EF-hand domain-containing protein [Saccharothrix algeriensis]MBM7814408.1 Ca2+-binding EF-hand superfamily protein [Saccharothrix algeriensis]QTR02716.1 EF-hand domain-containing protein [Saccharothrix algeriensis]